MKNRLSFVPFIFLISLGGVIGFNTVNKVAENNKQRIEKNMLAKHPDYIILNHIKNKDEDRYSLVKGKDTVMVYVDHAL